MPKVTLYAQKPVETEDPKHPGYKVGDPVATIESDMPLDRILNGLGKGFFTTKVPAPAATEPTTPAPVTKATPPATPAAK